MSWREAFTWTMDDLFLNKPVGTHLEFAQITGSNVNVIENFVCILSVICPSSQK